MYTFRRCTPNDLDAIMKIVEDAIALLKRNGLDQWQKGYPDRQAFTLDAETGTGYVALDEEGVAAVCAIVEGPEDDYLNIDGAWLTEGGRYAAIHRVAVRGDSHGKGLPAFLFERFEALARNEGMDSIRADTHPGNLAMQKSLERFGFRACGTIRLTRGAERGDPRIGYEKVLGDRL